MKEEEIERKLAAYVSDVFNVGARGIQTGYDESQPARTQVIVLSDDGSPMRVQVEGHGDFMVAVTAKRLPGGNRWRECATCSAGGHTCPGDGESIEHGQTDCGQHEEQRRGPSAFVQLAANDPSFGFTEQERQRILDEELSKVEISTEPGANPVGKLIEVNERVEKRMERDVSVSQLVTGDSVYSEGASTWHDVRVDGQALYLKRGESWVAMSHLPRDTVLRTRRGASGRAAGALFDNFGGEVIRDARD